MTEQETDEVMAAVDLGSNSFHMIVARLRHGQVEIIDRLREMVRLASGLTGSGFLDSASQDRALACLRRFGQRLRDMHADQVRVVGTNTLRKAHNAGAFLDAAEEALGHPVDVISGIEEARLIYQGVSHHVESIDGTDLVVDIGGGSTELILGRGSRPCRLESLIMGCVAMSQRYFRGARLTSRRFDQARLAADLELRPVVAGFRREGWDRVLGSSGTVRAASVIIQELGLDDGGITITALEAVIERMIEARRLENLSLPGLSPDRAPVFPGGVVILIEVLRSFGIERMLVSDGALREGLIYEMVGRLLHDDARERSIRAMQAKFHTDESQAQRVEATARLLLAEVAADWGLTDERHAQLLQWAARLHEIGLDIAHAKYHQHGAYLLANSDMSGFTRLEQRLLAFLVGNHRRKLEQLTMVGIPDDWHRPLFKLVVLLRLAVALNRARGPASMPQMRLRGTDNRLELAFDRKWFADNPLTHADLQQEQEYLSVCGFDLVLDIPRRVRPIPPAL